MERDVEHWNTAAYRAGLVEQIVRDMHSLCQDPVPHPGDTFYMDRLDMYRQSLAELDNADRGIVNDTPQP